MLFLMIYQILTIFIYSMLPDWLNGLPLLIINQFITFLIPLLAYLLYTRQSIWQILPNNRLGLLNIGLIFLMCVTVQPFMSLLSSLSSLLYTNNVSSLMDSLESYPFLYVLAAISLTPALCEEICFRGIILTNYRNVDIKKAAVINGFFFGIAHLDLQQFPYAFALGAVFAYFVYYTKSILASIFAHFTINSIQLGLSYSSSGMSDLQQYVPTMADKLNTILFMFVAAAIFTPVFIILLKAFISFNRRKNLVEEMQLHFLFLLDDPGPTKKEAGSCFTPAFWGVTGLFALFVILNIVVLFAPFL